MKPKEKTMSRKLMNLAALAVLLAGSGMAMAAHPHALRSGGRCSTSNSRARSINHSCASDPYHFS